MIRLDEDGPSALVQAPEPVIGFPDFVAPIVRRLRVLCPAMGTARIAAVLSRAGLHLGRTTVCRMLKRRPRRGCRRAGIRQRLGAIGKHGSIALVERCIRTIKENGVQRWLATIRWWTVGRELSLFADWYNGQRPHAGLVGATSDEIYFGRRPAHHRPRFEPRTRWPRSSRCARQQAPVRGRPGVRLALEVRYLEGRAQLPGVSLTRAA